MPNHLTRATTEVVHPPIQRLQRQPGRRRPGHERMKAPARAMGDLDDIPTIDALKAHLRRPRCRRMPRRVAPCDGGSPMLRTERLSQNRYFQEVLTAAFAGFATRDERARACLSEARARAPGRRVVLREHPESGHLATQGVADRLQGELRGGVSWASVQPRSRNTMMAIR
jgi:hypothetical protein